MSEHNEVPHHSNPPPENGTPNHGAPAHGVPEQEFPETQPAGQGQQADAPPFGGTAPAEVLPEADWSEEAYTPDNSGADPLGAPPDAPASGSDRHVVQTDADAKDGLSKCPQCGSTEISLNVASGLLRCHFCRVEWAGENALEAFGFDSDIAHLTGFTMGSGSADITPSTEDVMTFKCQACGAEVVIDTLHSTQARCHWCRNTLSMNQQVPNGAVPDMVLPFKVSKEDAVALITKFVNSRKYFAHRKFIAEFEPSNVMGVYLPHMVIDLNATASFAGQGEHLVRSYSVGSGDDKEDRYDADLYNLTRSFDLHINDFTIESSQERLDQSWTRNTNNIINAVKPFDVAESVKYDSNYVSGFTSERRDSNIEQLVPIVQAQTQDIARHAALDTIKFYGRGVRWHDEQMRIEGQRWLSAYLPVWLYSYQQVTGNGKTMLHYVAVNARTGKVMGSVPVNQRRLIAVSAAVQVAGIAAFIVATILGW